MNAHAMARHGDGLSTLPNSRGGAGALAEDALVQAANLTTRGVKVEFIEPCPMVWRDDLHLPGGDLSPQHVLMRRPMISRAF